MKPKKNVKFKLQELQQLQIQCIVWESHKIIANFCANLYSDNKIFMIKPSRIFYYLTRNTESRGRVVTRWPGSQKVGRSIPAAAKIVRWLGYHVKPLVPCILGESSPSM